MTLVVQAPSYPTLEVSLGAALLGLKATTLIPSATIKITCIYNDKNLVAKEALEISESLPLRAVATGARSLSGFLFLIGDQRHDR